MGFVSEEDFEVHLSWAAKRCQREGIPGAETAGAKARRLAIPENEVSRTEPSPLGGPVSGSCQPRAPF